MDLSGHCGKDPNGDFMPPAVVPEGKQLPAVYVPQQEALRRWCANFQDDAGTAGRTGTGGNGDFMPPAVIPKQPLPSLDPKRPSLVPEPPRQLPAVIYPQPQDLLGGNPQNRVSGPVADVPNCNNRTNGNKTDFYVTTNGDVVPATGYRYISENASYIDDMAKTMLIPANVNGTYLSFDDFDIANPGALQVPHDASIKVSFDTLQVIDDISVPHGDWGKASYLEPITVDFPQFGSGGATQAITHSKIRIDTIIKIPRNKGGK